MERFIRMLVSGLLLIMACHSFAQVAENAEASAGSVTQLSDRLHQIDQTLQSVTTIHDYSFISVRGQDVLLATPGADMSKSLWRLEYQVDGGKWEPKTSSSPVPIRNLKPGSEVKVRVLAAAGAQFQQAAYRVVFGSYPHMRYDLHHEEGLLKIPHGLTEPPFLATQAYTKALLEAWFTDSKAFPLEGGVIEFELDFKNGKKKLSKSYISDIAGKVSELVEFNRCEGGKYAGNFVHKNDVKGRNTWGTLYRVGQYSALNVLLENMADKPHEYDFGHICKRTLVNWSRN
ncbi:hypothetical protein ALQ04_01304 [Pseudomonas cichorii]|uniref:Lipoprotein n=1 Tax=Pseudomonas cichorii TaxID=36746 RepID=A0A3M4M7P6_PSECI|nr:hypothetical protein [Pseudomonas cichorii]RMQ49847.1 hypothetical protein ALQ04_01304 [Pseudomonas cichorii]